MKITKVVVGLLEENCYILEKDNTVIVIDPGDEYKKIKKVIGNKKVKKVLITHHHPDHIGALKYFDENLILTDLKEKTYNIGSFEFEVIFTKGHTNDSVTYYFKKDKIMFTGDFIFKDSIGRTDMPTGSMQEMILSLKKISNYPNVTIYPGHGDKTTLEYEKKHNYWLI